MNDNELWVLPRELGDIEGLQTLTTGCNPMMIPPPGVCRKGKARRQIPAARECVLFQKQTAISMQKQRALSTTP